MPRLFKCKGMAGLYAPRALGLMAANRGQINGAHSASDHCDCEPNVPLKRKKALTKKSASQYSFTYFVQVFLLAQWLGVLRKRLIIIVYVGALWAAFGHIAQLLLVQGPLLILFPSFSCLLSLVSSIIFKIFESLFIMGLVPRMPGKSCLKKHSHFSGSCNVALWKCDV